MNDKPLFSILIANYNNGKYLKDAIESVQVQTYSNWEIILVDDGSTDNSHELYKELEKDERIHIFYNGKNKGVAYTKHRCIELANGEICGFLDAHDALSSDALSIMAEEHRKNENIALVYSTFYYCDENLNIQYISPRNCALPKNMTFLEYGKEAISHFATFKKDFYKKTNGMAQNIEMAEDYDLYFKLEEVGEVKFIPNMLYYYRTHAGNMSLGENVKKSAFWGFVVMVEACKRRNIPIETILPHFIDFVAEYEKQINKLQQTKTYKLANVIATPFRWIKKYVNGIE